MILGLVGVAGVGCAHRGADSFRVTDVGTALRSAKGMMADGELYRAKRTTLAVLEKEPHHVEAEQLMATILDQEISREKEVSTKSVDEFTTDEKKQQIRTWLERARTFLGLKQYDQAVLAAEKAFLYEAENYEASHLIDEIKERAYREGRGDTVVLGQMIEGEMRMRIQEYREQAQNWVREGQWGAARLAVEKILLLHPDDREALKLQEVIQGHQTKAEGS